MNARRLSHLKNAGASAALEIARQDVLADVQQHISLSTLDMAQCVSDFSAANHASALRRRGSVQLQREYRCLRGPP